MKVSVLLAQLGGVGLLPYFPGTWGSLASLLLFYAVHRFCSTLNLYIVATLMFCFLAWPICHFAEKQLGKKDDSSIVIDEAAGMLVTMTGLGSSYLAMATGFVLFRAFDIIKPPPIRWLDRQVKGGFGVLIDDVIAGIFACLIAHLALPYLQSMVASLK